MITTQELGGVDINWAVLTGSYGLGIDIKTRMKSTVPDGDGASLIYTMGVLTVLGTEMVYSY